MCIIDFRVFMRISFSIILFGGEVGERVGVMGSRIGCVLYMSRLV